MELQSLAKNRTVLIFNNGITEILFSYSTPVAGYKPNIGYVKTNQWYSSTTTRHINKYLDDNFALNVEQDTINNLIGERIPDRY
jgi:predicted membrane-bound dolichyl-phosphate-mannose-protein mannosyltransferase